MVGKVSSMLGRLCAAVLLATASSAFADLVDPATIRKGDVGPPTTYGETPAESAAKKIVFEWNYTSMIQRDPKHAFTRYVSSSYCDHSHLATGGHRECAGYAEMLAHWMKLYGQPLVPGERIEIPTMATVDGEMVTLYGTGVDIFRVHDGKITDHWDASPPTEVTLKAHKPAFLKWLLSDRQGPPPNEGPSISAVTVSEKLLNAVDVGPVTPFGETPQEAARKRILFEFNHLTMIKGKSGEAFEKYVSKEYCGHGHLSTRMRTECGTYAEALEHSVRFDKPKKIGERLEIPTTGSVNGEMVILYGAGVDIFRVHDGKITDHWDASPPADVTVKGHSSEFVARMVKVVAGELPNGQTVN